MPKRDPTLLINDMIEAIGKIERYISQLTQKDFESNNMIIDAVVRNLEIIGEAARQIPDEVRLQAPQIDWRCVIGLRNVVVHQF